jgi:hypothetical protein
MRTTISLSIINLSIIILALATWAAAHPLFYKSVPGDEPAPTST